MKKLISIVLLVIMLVVVAQPPAFAAELSGKDIFKKNCNACHAKGRNTIAAQKTLKKDALAKYLDGYNDNPVAAITKQVTYGKPPMPAFGGKLSEEEIQKVVAYVIDQSEKGWKKKKKKK